MPSNQSNQLKTASRYDFSFGMVTNWSFSKVPVNACKLIQNGDLTEDGAIIERYGKSKVNYNDAFVPVNVSSLFSLGQTTGGDLIIANHYTPSAINELNEVSGGASVLIRSGISGGPLSGTVIDDYLACCNGTVVPFITNGTAIGTYQLGIDPASGTIAHVPGVAGAVTTPGWHRIRFRWSSTITGARGNPNPAGGNILIAGGDQYSIAVFASAVSADPQVDGIEVFVQEAGAAVDAPYFYLGTCPNAVSVTNFDVSDSSLMVGEVLDIDDNVAPTSLRDIENFKGRLVGVSGDYTVRFSKKRVDQNGVVNLPTSWPATNELNIGWGDGDPLVKVVVFGDTLMAFKRRSIWLLVGDFDSSSFEFKKLKANYTNVGLLNRKCICQAGNSVYFVSDDLKFHRFGMTDFSDTQLRLSTPALSDRIGNIFYGFASAYRENVNIVNFTFAQYTQIWICFSDGNSFGTTGENNNVLVFDYGINDGAGAWSIHTNMDIASSTLARASDLNYYVYSGSYAKYVWRHDASIGDGAALNGISTGGNTANTFNDTAVIFTNVIDGCKIKILSGTGAGQVRTCSVAGVTQLSISPVWSVVPDSTSIYTIGGIDFQVHSRDDWLDDEAPPDFDKEGWYLDLDVSTDTSNPAAPLISDLQIVIYKNRLTTASTYNKSFTFTGATWGYAYWGVDYWPETKLSGIQVGLNLYFSQIAHKIIHQIAGQRIRVNGWTYTYQRLGKLRVK